MRQNILPVNQLILVVVILAIGAGFTLYVFNKDYGLTYELRSEGIHIAHEGASLVSAGDFVVQYENITSIQVLEQFPKHRKKIGINGTVRIGTFDVEGIGIARLYAKTTKRPLVLVYTSDAVYGVTPENTQDFVDHVSANLAD